MRLIITLTIFFLGFTNIISFASQQNLWVSAKGAKLKESPNASSATIAELLLGTQLTVENNKRRWYQVTTIKGNSGWIYRGKVSKDKPAAASSQPPRQDTSLGNALAGLTGSSITSDSADSARSIRGLSPDTEEYARQTGTPEEVKKALDSILVSQASQREVELFLQTAKIGEYAD